MELPALILAHLRQRRVADDLLDAAAEVGATLALATTAERPQGLATRDPNECRHPSALQLERFADTVPNGQAISPPLLQLDRFENASARASTRRRSARLCGEVATAPHLVLEWAE
jgi:hypothetical protein